jgi:hypothetical protein
MTEEMTDETFAEQTAQGICLVLFYKNPNRGLPGD